MLFFATASRFVDMFAISVCRVAFAGVAQEVVSCEASADLSIFSQSWD